MQQVPIEPVTPAATVAGVATERKLLERSPAAHRAELGLDEASAVSRAQDGDLQAFEALVDRYQGAIFRLAVQIVRDRAQAEDIVQDTFIAAWRKLPTLQQPGAFRSWLYQVATRRSLDVLRRTPLQVQLDEDVPAQSTVASTTADPERVALQRAELDDLHRVLGELPAEQRACWTLREFHDLSYGEIAAALGLPIPTVRGRIARARGTLAERMTSWR